jgi:fimbrial chaperone protein
MNPVHPASRYVRVARTLALAAVVLATLVAPEADAGVFSVVPVRIYMTPRDRAVAITVTNEGDTEMVLQAEVNTWRQKPDGTDEQVASEDLILSPPILKLPPRARQVVRLARLGPPDATQQLTYRLIMREVPEVGAPKDRIQIPVALALSMPVFITPPGAKREMKCDAARGNGSIVQVSCANAGNAYAQVRSVQVLKGADVLGKLDGGFYVLPGARKTLTVTTQQPVPSGSTLLNVTFDDGKTESFDVVIP